MEALHTDVRSTRSNELDSDKIDANLKGSVLTVRITKRVEMQPGKFEVPTS